VKVIYELPHGPGPGTFPPRVVLASCAPAVGEHVMIMLSASPGDGFRYEVTERRWVINPDGETVCHVLMCLA
jgi:hypothetical protein